MSALGACHTHQALLHGLAWETGIALSVAILSKLCKTVGIFIRMQAVKNQFAEFPNSLLPIDKHQWGKAGINKFTMLS